MWHIIVKTQSIHNKENILKKEEKNCKPHTKEKSSEQQMISQQKY